MLSLLLSFSSAGSHCYWQDSGFFLVAVKELGVLYPPGFAVYVLLCKAWTRLLFFVDFTYAVHLFSAFCAAAAAGTLAVAARDLLRTKGPLFRSVEEQGSLSDWVGVSIGCLAASGYTFWAAAILAKVYAFYYLILALLIWRMIRADEDRRPRDFTIVAVLIGLAWQAHPSATNAGLALLLFVAFHRSVVGGKGIAWRTALAAICGIGPIHLIPFFPMLTGYSSLKFGDPSSWSGFWEYVFGSRFTTNAANFGLEGSRVASVGRYFWEEFLGIGVLLVGAGGYRLWTLNRRLLIGLAAWIVPVIVITVLFKLEGQHDFWMVAAWIPLWLVAAIGLSLVRQRRALAAALALVGWIWAVGVNWRDLDQRNYTLAETLGKLYLDAFPPGGGTLQLESDDAYSTTLYLQRIHQYGGSVFLVPPYQHRFELPYIDLLGRHTLDERTWPNEVFWKDPFPPESLPGLFRRARGQYVERIGDTVHVRPEPYEKRLLRALLLARKSSAHYQATRGRIAEAARLYESIPALDPDLKDEVSIVFPLAVLDAGLMRLDRAEAGFKKALTLDPEPNIRAQAYYFLALLCGNRPEAAEWRAKALATPQLPQELRGKLEGR
jgi:tetratricopeptide (TPR) repeat protein